MRDALVRLGGFVEPPLEPIVPARSRLRLPQQARVLVRAPARTALVLGFHRAGRWDEVIDVEECLLTTDVGNAIREAVKEWAREEGLEAYDQETQTGYLRHLVVREGRNTGQALVMLVTAPGEQFDTGFLIETLTRVSRGAVDPLGDQRPRRPRSRTCRRGCSGVRTSIEEELLGLRFRVRPNAFLQTNTEMAETLYALAREAAGLTGSETVYDLYCGTGTIGLALARRRAHGLGRRDLGGVRRVRDRERRAERDRRTPPSSPGTSASRSRSSRERAGAPDVVVVDPPRAGLAGKALRRTGALAGAADRLRLVQPDDARLRPRRAPRRVRLRARALHARRHVPAHTAHRERVAAAAAPAILPKELMTVPRRRDRLTTTKADDMNGTKAGGAAACGARAGQRRAAEATTVSDAAATPTRRSSRTDATTERTTSATETDGTTHRRPSDAAISRASAPSSRGSRRSLAGARRHVAATSTSATAVFDELADQVPEEITDDYEVARRELRRASPRR